MGFIVQTSLGQPANVILTGVTCDPSVYIGAAVIMDVLGVAYNGLADSEANSNVIGIVEAKASSTVCTIRVLGVTDTIYAGLDPTKEYFLSDVTPGLITTTPPGPITGRIILKLGQPFSATRLLVLKGIRMERA